MRLSSFSVVSEANSSICADKASAQTDMERMENPFRNLHPKIYYRQKNVPSRKLILDNKREVRMDVKTSPLLRVNMKNDHSTKHFNSSWPVKVDGYSVISEKTARGKGCEDFEEGRQNNKTIAYLNERNISLLSKDASEGQKLALPLLVFPRAATENENLLNTNFHPSGKSDKGFSFPPIKKVPSFIPLVREEEQRKRKRLHKKVRNTQTTRISEQEDECWWNTYTAANSARLSTREDLADQTIPPKYSQKHKILLESDMGKKGRGSQGVSKDTNFSSANATQAQGLSARTYRSHDDFMILKAKIHRSSVL